MLKKFLRRFVLCKGGVPPYSYFLDGPGVFHSMPLFECYTIFFCFFIAIFPMYQRRKMFCHENPGSPFTAPIFFKGFSSPSGLLIIYLRIYYLPPTKLAPPL